MISARSAFVKAIRFLRDAYKLHLIQIKLILQNQFDCRASLQQVRYFKGYGAILQKCFKFTVNSATDCFVQIMHTSDNEDFQSQTQVK